MARRLEGEVTLRPKRQLTLPVEICEELGIEPGDLLELSVEGRVLTAKPRKARAMDAIQEIRDSFARSGITEEELLKSGRSARREINLESNGRKS
jgi:bifunctional DNA-binding transcriptional regulator/antitoxin component of YhaV-PrlF toxin-antitoxin module